MDTIDSGRGHLASAIGPFMRLRWMVGCLGLLAASASWAVPLACATQPPDLAAWWSGEDNPLDRLGSYPGTLDHGTGYGPGFVGRAFQFDGIDDSMRVGFLGGIGLTETDPVSIAAWANTSTAATAALQVVAGNYMGEQGGSGNFSMYLMINNGNLVFSVDQRQVAGVSLSTPISDGWHFVTATYDGSALALYVDGEARGSNTRNFTGAAANTRGWTVGNFSDETNAGHGYNSSFNGLIDEVTLFGRALSLAEIGSIFGAGAAGICTPTIFANGFEGS